MLKSSTIPPKTQGKMKNDVIIFFFIYLLRLLVSTDVNKQFVNYKKYEKNKK